ncbi:MAG: AAA family ATPase [Flavobacteriaceae bacterium]|nr:MAG: AAA family ATPase [Flavobacteriaceae bacterium]
MSSSKKTTDFYEDLIKKHPYSPTNKQAKSFRLLTSFIFDSNTDSIFLLKGYAGTGKTAVISTVVNNLWETGKKAVLLAPTGRAAKVISVNTKKQAFTIHKKIYFPKKQKDGTVDFVIQPNRHTNTLFIIDEASMISDTFQDTRFFDKRVLLDDLVSYVYSGRNCKMIFIGDTAQLPPVKSIISPALEAERLETTYHKEIIEIELDEVVRQQEYSGILANATLLRMLIDNNAFHFKFDIEYPDVIRLTDGYDMEDAMVTAYNNEGIEDTVFIVRTNKRANQYNQQIRTRIVGQENEISTGDHIMVVKNNYFWLKNASMAHFIANGDICEILRIRAIKELYGFRFVEVEIRMIDYPDQKPFETILLLDTLTSEKSSLSHEDSTKLYEAVKEDYAHEKPRYKQVISIKENKYFNALQIKFSYAITCHKSQGGQWNTVFIEQPYLPTGPDKEYLRWLYTAITRARKKLYLIGFKDDFFELNSF